MRMRIIILLVFVALPSCAWAESLCYKYCTYNYILGFSYDAKGYGESFSPRPLAEDCGRTRSVPFFSSADEKFKSSVCAYIMGNSRWETVYSPSKRSREYIEYKHVEVVSAALRHDERRAFAVLEEIFSIYQPWSLKGDIEFNFKRYEDAYRSYVMAYELDPSCRANPVSIGDQCYSFDSEMAMLGVFSSLIALDRKEEACSRLGLVLQGGFYSDLLDNIFEKNCHS